MMEYRGNFFFWTFVSTMWGLFHVFFMELMISANGGSIAGWSRHEIFVLVGISTMLDGLIWSVMYHNMVDYTKYLFNGYLSSIMLKPIDTQFFIMAHTGSYTNAVRIVIGFLILLRQFSDTGLWPTTQQAIIFCLMFATALSFLYLFWFTISTLGMWVNRLNNINEIVPNLLRIWRFPRSVYTGIFSTILTVILPLGLISSLPAEALLGKATLSGMSYFLAYTVVAAILSRAFFNLSIRRYSGVGG